MRGWLLRGCSGVRARGGCGWRYTSSARLRVVGRGVHLIAQLVAQ